MERNDHRPEGADKVKPAPIESNSTTCKTDQVVKIIKRLIRGHTASM
jgi:hypothetical protein